MESIIIKMTSPIWIFVVQILGASLTHGALFADPETHPIQCYQYTWVGGQNSKVNTTSCDSITEQYQA